MLFSRVIHPTMSAYEIYSTTVTLSKREKSIVKFKNGLQFAVFFLTYDVDKWQVKAEIGNFSIFKIYNHRGKLKHMRFIYVYILLSERRFIDYDQIEKQFRTSTFELTFYVDVGDRIPSRTICLTKTQRLNHQPSTTFIFENGAEFELLRGTSTSSQSSLCKYYVQNQKRTFTIFGVFGMLLYIYIYLV